LQIFASAKTGCAGATIHSVGLKDDLRISVPLEWYPRLARASAAERSNWEICGGGYGIHWPDIDEDLATEGLLRGVPAPGSG